MATTKGTVAADEEVWDSIVIGSGLGGMSAASLLSQCQKDHRVLVLEQHPYHVGGCCQSFERNGYRFGVGLHLVGGMEEDDKSGLKRLFDALTPVDDSIEWTEIPEPDTVLIGKDRFKKYVSDKSKSQQDNLIEMFPSEKDGIKKFFALCERATASYDRAHIFKCLPRWISSTLIHTGLDRLFDKGYRKYSQTTVREVVQSLVKDPDLQTMLESPSLAYGMLPQEAPIVFHSVFFSGDMSSLYYPSGGPGEIPKKISAAIKACGGDVRMNSPVKAILVEERRAVGVVLADGHTIRAKHIISDAGLVTTFHHLVPVDHQNRLGATSTKSFHNGMTGIVLYVGLAGDCEDDFSLPCIVSALCDNPFDTVPPDSLEKLQAMKADDLSIYATCPSRKDGSWKSSYPGKTTLEIMLMNVPWAAFEEYLGPDNKIIEEKKKEYVKFKNNFGQLLWTRSRQALVAAGASDKLPKQLGDADFVELGTPLTFHHYLGSDLGAWYGLEHSTDRFSPRNFYLALRPECGIDGLYLTGQDISSDGIAGALMGGYICATKVLREGNPFGLAEKVTINRASKVVGH